MKKYIFTLLILCAAYWCYNKTNDNFSVANITLKQWPDYKAVPTNTPEEIKLAKTILQQPFTYLGRGRQSFVFESKDQKYVLKFLKCQRINVSRFYETMPLFGFLDRQRQKSIDQRQDRLVRYFTSMSLAKDPLGEETGIVLLHIQQDKSLNTVVTLRDNIGFTHTVDLDTTPFVLQKKAQKIMPVLKKCLKNKDFPELQKRLDQLIALFIKRASLGIINPDSSLLRHNNVGYLNDSAIYIDIGTFKRSSRSASRQYLKRDFKRLNPLVNWLKEKNKTLAVDFQHRIDIAVDEYVPAAQS